MWDFTRRLWDGDFHVVEEIVMDDKDVAHHSWFHDLPEKKNTNPEVRILLQNIETNNEYYFQTTENIDSDNIENWDIVEIKFIKDYKQKELSIIMRFYVKMRYSGSMLWFIYILDDSTKYDSKARAEKLALPIVSGWKRKLILTESLGEAIMISTNQFLHEMRIKEMKIYKKGTKVDSITWFLKWKIGWLLRK